jgi:excisionase family DNA binding protein
MNENVKEIEGNVTPAELAARWRCHPETVRRKLRDRKIASIIIGRRRLVPLGEVTRIEAEAFIPAQQSLKQTISTTL